MSMFYCVGCQQYKDSDRSGINDGEDGQYCDDCFDIETKKSAMQSMEKIAEQVDQNSIETFELDKRVKKLEGEK